jgi:hypothetical protein
MKSSFVLLLLPHVDCQAVAGKIRGTTEHAAILIAITMLLFKIAAFLIKCLNLNQIIKILKIKSSVNIKNLTLIKSVHLMTKFGKKLITLNIKSIFKSGYGLGR